MEEWSGHIAVYVSKFSLFFRFVFFLFANAGDSAEDGCDENAGGAYGKQRHVYGHRKRKTQGDDKSHYHDAEYKTAEKRVFASCTRGDMSADARGYEKGNERKNFCVFIGVVQRKGNKARKY